MYSKKNLKNLKKKLKDRKTTIGGWLQIPSASIAEIFSYSDFEWVVIDMEHGAFDLSQLPNIIRSIELNNKICLVRVAKLDTSYINQILDCGACGIILANCKNDNDLRKLIKNCTLPPIGIRGVGFSRANLFGKNFNSYQSDLVKPIFIAQIENKDGYENLDKILSVNGLDSILIGPYDLSASLNLTSKFNSYEFKKIINKIKIKCKSYRKSCGIHVVENDIKELQSSIKQGFNFIPFSTDGQILHSSISKLKLNKL